MKSVYVDSNDYWGTPARRSEPVCAWSGKEIFGVRIYCTIHRLTCHAQKIEEFQQAVQPDVALVVGVHCHVNLETILKTVKAKKEIYAIMIPCCIELLTPEMRMNNIIHQYHDQGIPSPQNKVYITKHTVKES
jgi:hypothetical protein